MVATCLEPQEVAAALGIDRSVLEHWIIEGWLPTHDRRTGDNRIDLAEALRFIRHYHLTMHKPDAIGLSAGMEPETLQAERRELTRALHAPDPDALTNLLIARYASCADFAAYFDRVLTPVARRQAEPAPGHADPVGRITQSLRALAELIRPDDCRAPAAITAALDGVADPVPSAMAAVILADRMHRAQDLGPGSIAPTLVRAAVEQRAVIVYVYLGDAAVNTSILRDQLAYLSAQLINTQARLLAGGALAQQHPEILPHHAAAIPNKRALDAYLTRHG